MLSEEINIEREPGSRVVGIGIYMKTHPQVQFPFPVMHGEPNGWEFVLEVYHPDIYPISEQFQPLPGVEEYGGIAMSKEWTRPIMCLDTGIWTLKLAPINEKLLIRGPSSYDEDWKLPINEKRKTN